MKKMHVSFGLLFPFLAVSQFGDESVHECTTDIASDGHHYFSGDRGNMAFSLGLNGALIFDCRYEYTVNKLKTEIRASSDNSVQYLINTHHHAVRVNVNGSPCQDATIHAHGFMCEYHFVFLKTTEVIHRTKRQGLTPEKIKAACIPRNWERSGRFFVTENLWIDTTYPMI